MMSMATSKTKEVTMNPHLCLSQRRNPMRAIEVREVENEEVEVILKTKDGIVNMTNTTTIRPLIIRRGNKAGDMDQSSGNQIQMIHISMEKNINQSLNRREMLPE
jgi:hypothetical protein